MSIPSIFDLEGEAGFRAHEEAAIADASCEGGRIIATGGGAPMFKDNRTLLKQNGHIIYIERALGLLPTNGRPLSKNLTAMYEKRAPVYRAFADAVVENSGTVADAVAAILQSF